MKHIFPPLLLAILYLASCKNELPPPTEPPPLPPLDSIEIVNTPDPYYLRKYSGDIGGKYPIEMVLINWGDGFISGRYWYSNKKQPIELSGELKTADNSFDIAEFFNGKVGAKFLGKNLSPDSIAGTWSSVDGKKNYPFRLIHAPTDNDNNSWTGNWHLNQVWDGGWLMVGNVTTDSFDFALSVVRGSHVGTLEGRAKQQENTAVYKQKTFEDKPCELHFQNNGDHILIDQKSDNLACGFGARAYASGRFERQKIIRKSMLTIGTGDDDVFPNQAMHDEFRKMVGSKKYEEFAFNMQVKERTANPKGETVITGAVPGLFTTNEAIIIFDGKGKIWAGNLEFVEGIDEPQLHVYTNDAASRLKLHPEIEAWRERFKGYKIVF